MSKFKVIKKVTKKWTSGVSTFAVIGDGEHSERNYIILERVVNGRPTSKFNLYFTDWTKLKELIEGELMPDHAWPVEDKFHGEAEVLHALQEVFDGNPDFLEKILTNGNIAKLSKASFEALDKLGARVYEIKAENLDFLLQQLADADGSELNNFVSLLNELKIGQISSITELVRKKIAVLTLLENLMSQATTKEKEIHKLLESNLWLLDNNYDLVRSNKPLSDLLNASNDPDLEKRPDLIVQNILQEPSHLIIVELKRPFVKLNNEHLGQALGYKGIVQAHNPEIKKIDVHLIGYALHANMPRGLTDVNVRLLSNIATQKRREFDDFLKIVEDNQELELDM